MELVNAQTGKPETLDKEALIPALAAGTHSPLGARALFTPDGELVFTPMANVKANLTQYGYTIPTQEQLTELANQQQYGEGAGNVAKASLEGAARGATFGLSDFAEPYVFGTTPEAIAQRRERNPTASTIGEIGGAVGSALLAPELAPAGLLSKAGIGIAERLAPKALGEGASIAARALNAAGQVGAKAAGSAVEGAAYGLGQTVTEAALGDPNLNAEKVLANIGYGGLFGGALGGVLKAGEIVIPASVAKAKDTFQSTYNRLVGKVGAGGEFEAGPLTKGIAKAGSFATGEPEQEILDHAKKVLSGDAEILSEKQRRVYYREFNSALEDQYKAVSKASRETSTAVRPQETAALLADADPQAAIGALEGTRTSLRQAIAEMQAAPELYPPRFPAKLQQIADALDDKTRIPEMPANRHYTAGARAAARDQVVPELKSSDIFEAIHDAKKAIDDKIPWNKEISGEAADAVSLIKNVRAVVKNSLEDEAVWGEAGARTAAYNNSVNDFLTTQKEFQKAFMRKIPTRSGGVTYVIDPTKTNSFFNMINDPRGELKGEVLKNFFRSSRGLIDEVDRTYQSTAFERFDKAAMTSLIDKNEGMATRAKNIIEAQPNRGFGFVTDMFGAALAATGNPLGAVAVAAKSILDPRTTISRLGNIERAAQKSTQTISAASREIFNPITAKAKRLIGPVSGQLTEEATRQEFDTNVRHVEEQNSAPAEAIDKLELATRDLYHVAPNISAGLQMATIRGSMFLGSKLPRPSRAQLPFDPPFRATMPQIIKFNRYYQAVHRPLTALDELKAGRIYPETVEALNEVYPQLYTEMKAEVIGSMTAIMGEKHEVPYQQRLAISTFLGAPLDSSILPASIQSNQKVLGGQAAKNTAQETASAASPKGIGKIDLSGRLKTNVQNSAQRSDA